MLRLLCAAAVVAGDSGYKRAGIAALDNNQPYEAKKLFQQAASDLSLAPQAALEARTYLAESLLGCIVEHIQKYPELVTPDLEQDVEQFNIVLRLLGREAPHAFTQGLRDINAYVIQNYGHDTSRHSISSVSGARPALKLSTTVAPDGGQAEHAIENTKLLALELISTTNWNRDMNLKFDGNISFTLPNVSFSHGGAKGAGQLFVAATPPWCVHQEEKLRSEYLHHKIAVDGVQLAVFKDGFVGKRPTNSCF
jgi:hypothetical protein